MNISVSPNSPSLSARPTVGLIPESSAATAVCSGELPLFNRLGGRPVLRELLRHFYSDIRQHKVLGPVFLSKIQDWPVHLEKIADFWTTITGGPVMYSGQMARKHQELQPQLEHFEIWLDLWRHQCRARLQPNEAQEMIEVAERIADRLRRVCGLLPLEASPIQFAPYPKRTN